MDMKVTHEFIVESGIPLASRGGNGKLPAWRKYPFNTMKVGDSFLLPVGADVVKISNAASAFGKVNEMKFSVRKVSHDPKQYRCWRIS